MQVTHIRVVSACCFGDTGIPVTVESIPADALVRIIDWCAQGVKVAVVGDVACATLRHALRNSITSVSVITMAVIEVYFWVVKARRVLRTPRTIAELCVRDACVILVFYISFNALADVLVALGVWSTFSVVFAVGVVFATEVWAANVTVAVVTEVADADKLIGACVDAVRVEAACAVGSSSLDTFERIAFVAFWAYAVLSFPFTRSVW